MAKASVNKVMLLGKIAQSPQFVESVNGELCSIVTDFTQVKNGKTEVHSAFNFVVSRRGGLSGLAIGCPVFIEGHLETMRRDDKGYLTYVVIDYLEVLMNEAS